MKADVVATEQEILRTDVVGGEYWGCGRKLPPDLLAPFRRVVQSDRNQSLPTMAGLDQRGDVGQARLDSETTIIQTVDVVLPLPVEGELWGRAAALHCLSDAFAAGARPVAAVGLVGIRSDGHRDAREHTRIAYESAVDTLNDEGVGLVGGHSMWDSVDKLGFAITGVGHVSELRTTGAARAGDRLFLTKPIGFGAALALRQSGLVGSLEVADVLELMSVSNSGAGRAAAAAGSTCASDVTGFGLLGTALQVAADSGLTLELDIDAVPTVAVATQAIQLGQVSPLGEAVWFGSDAHVTTDRGLDECMLLTDPQVNGGLLVSVAARAAAAFRSAADDLGVPRWEIGRVTKRQNNARVVIR